MPPVIAPSHTLEYALAFIAGAIACWIVCRVCKFIKAKADKKNPKSPMGV